MSDIVSHAPFDPEDMLRNFRAQTSESGAIVSFTGIVRHDDGVETLRLSHYPGFTEAEIEKICDKARARWALETIKVVHRVGDMSPGDPIVFVATASAHRRDAFQAADFVMDYLKSSAPFWKKEIRKDKEIWIEPRQVDYDDKKRWE